MNWTSLHTILVESCTTCPFVYALFYLQQCLQDSSILLHVSEFHSILRLKNIPLYILYAAFCLSIKLPMVIWEYSHIFTFVNNLTVNTMYKKYLFKFLLSALLVIHIEVKLLAYIVLLCLIFEKLSYFKMNIFIGTNTITMRTSLNAKNHYLHS